MSQGVSCEELVHLNPLEHLPEDHFLAVIYGVRRSGKTTMLRQFVYDMYPKMSEWKVFVFCSTAQFNTTSYDWIPKKAIYSDTSDINKIMEELLSSQREKLEKLSKEGKLEKETKAKGGGAGGKDKAKQQGGKRSNPNHAHEKEKKQKLTEAAKYAMQSAGEQSGEENDVPDILVIMDDVMSEDSIRHARAMGTVAMNGRQYRISCIILSQMVAGSGSIPPRVRTQVRSLVLPFGSATPPTLSCPSTLRRAQSPAGRPCGNGGSTAQRASRTSWRGIAISSLPCPCSA